MAKRPDIVTDLITTAREHLRMVNQWRGDAPDSSVYARHRPEWLSSALVEAAKADAIIGFLEVRLCGSYGGFDKGQDDATRRTPTLRLDWIEKHKVRIKL